MVELESPYKTPMRLRYRFPRPVCAQKVLEPLAENCPYWNDLFYFRKEEKARVIAAYAFSDRLGCGVEKRLFIVSLRTQAVLSRPSSVAEPYFHPGPPPNSTLMALQRN
ncbi:MAG: hypothetical protein NZ958_03160 [Bacteroidia bacterium]|nr:hypothetical protein [Bacteroidia bacterium]MDW8088222.1 hypothetical protein [Bacteroidia bacterium]